MANLKKNIAYNFTYQVLILILPFITAPYLSRVIGASGVGTYSFAYSVALYFTYFTLLGLNNYGNRTIASVQSNVEKRSRAFTEMYAMQILTFILSAIVYVLYVLFFSVDKVAATIMGILVLSSALDINWFFFGMELFKLTVTRNALIKVGTAICIFVFVKEKNDVYKYILIMALSVLLSQMCLWPFVKKYIHLSKPRFKDIKKHFKPNLILFVPVIAISLYKIMDKVMLGYMSTMSEVGFYENAEKIINIALTLINAVGTVMLPRMTALISQNNVKESRKYIDKSMLLVLAYSNAVMFGIFSVGNMFATVYYGDEFKRTGEIMVLLAVTVVFLGCGNVIRTQFLIPMKQDKAYIYSAVIGAAVNLIINSLLIPRYAAIGAAIGTIAAELCVLIYQLFYCRRELNLFKFAGYELVFCFFGLLMVALIKVLPDFGSSMINLMVSVIVGGGFYIVLVAFYLVKFQKFRIPCLKK